MRKHSKFITILLSALLAVCLVQTVFVQAFATEMDDDDFGWGNASTSDEAETVYPVSMEVVKAPESVTVNENFSNKNQITDSTFWSNVVLHIVYSNGEEYDVNCDGIDSEDGIVPPIAEINGHKGKIYYGTNSENEDTISFYIAYDYAEDDGVTCAVSADFSAEKKVDPHTIVRYELTKLPDMVFTKPLFTGSRDDISTGEEWNEWMNSLDVNNSISNHIDGMEITYYYANGEKRSVVVNSSNLKSFALMPWFAMYRVENYGECVDEYGNYLVFQVDDLGDYKFSVSLGSSDTEMIYTAKSVDNPNPSLNPVSTEDTPAKPEKPSDNISSATSDVATNDNANNNNSTNGTANNGVVATGDFATPAIIATVMILAAAVMFVLKRKHTF
ncbi:hypothetical protein DW017_04965 [Ruminococcus sp. AF37-3AC]|nr:hypothetical protein [Ruminococcus sp. AF37-3AC]OLA73080.1 MAG: hypothetical protein BHW51_07355 [Ruminococcus sp. CAG:9-related_41_34]RGF42982.1 hypothetical protein DW017_04965 [Ruminococcus sp. AF37-3AC]